MLVLYKLYEMQIQKRVDEHRTNFNPAEPSVKYDYSFRRQLDNKIDGMETSLVRNFANSQHHFVDELALLKSQVAEMVDCLKELRDAKKGEGMSSKKRRLL
ncbi:hypothetical protein F511_14812 [Dorcoceras hygrometricum]|uniref:Uncharacterized protein n=1 Tax=Dorcoceras hygrometricum TaxID=472368 RepID=A0A2Z7D8N5_9LAMI|nr:hypothetical protein F511_14812 [Dorcoceras hygrometricum]